MLACLTELLTNLFLFLLFFRSIAAPATTFKIVEQHLSTVCKTIRELNYILATKFGLFIRKQIDSFQLVVDNRTYPSDIRVDLFNVGETKNKLGTVINNEASTCCEDIAMRHVSTAACVTLTSSSSNNSSTTPDQSSATTVPFVPSKTCAALTSSPNNDSSTTPDQSSATTVPFVPSKTCAAANLSSSSVTTVANVPAENSPYAGGATARPAIDTLPPDTAAILEIAIDHLKKTLVNYDRQAKNQRRLNRNVPMSPMILSDITPPMCSPVESVDLTFEDIGSAKFSSSVAASITPEEYENNQTIDAAAAANPACLPTLENRLSQMERDNVIIQQMLLQPPSSDIILVDQSFMPAMLPPTVSLEHRITKLEHENQIIKNLLTSLLAK